MIQKLKVCAVAYGLRFSSFQLNLILLFSFLFLPAPFAQGQERADSIKAAQGAKDIRTLEPGKPIERELSGGEAHVYQITLTAGQYLHLVVEQRGIDVVVRLLGPDNKQFAEVDSPNGAQGPEPISWVAEASGRYRLEVRSLEKEAPTGRYEVKVEQLREATTQDRNRITAEMAFVEAEQLRAQGTRESLHKAINKYAAALPFWQAINDVYKQAETHNNTGTAFYFLGEFQRALDSYKEALPLIRAANNRQGEAYTLINMGLVYDAFGEKQNALESYTQALHLLRALEDRYGEAFALSNLGLLYDSLGEKQRALEHHFQALGIRRDLKDQKGEANTLNGIGAVYTSLGDLQKGLEYFTQALQLRRTTGDRYGEAATLNNLGRVYSNRTEKQKALDYYNQALDLWRTLGDRDGEATALNNIGMVYYSSGEKQKAIEYLDQVLPLRRATPNRNGEATALQNLGTIHASLGDRREAIEYYKQALALRRAVDDRHGEAESLYSLARVDRDHGDLNAARDKIMASLKVVESLRAKVSGQGIRASYFASIQQYYEFYIDLLMQQHRLQPDTGHAAAALHANERARARSLLETLSEARIDIRHGVDSTLVSRERLLQQQLNAKEQNRMRLLSGNHTHEQAETAEKEIASLLTQYQEVQGQIRASSPSYAALTQPQPLTLAEIQQQVVDDETVLLEYALGEKHSFLWVVTPTALASFELVGREIIETMARRVYALLMARNQKPPAETSESLEQAEEQFYRAADSLSQMVLAPAASLLGSKRLLIVAEGALQYIPFGALPVPMNDRTQELLNTNYRPLIVDHEIVSLPSASVLAVLRRERVGRHSAPGAVVVFADPVFSKDDPRLKRAQKNGVHQSGPNVASADTLLQSEGDVQRGADEVGLDIQRLPFSRREADAIVALAPDKESRPMLDFAASRKNLESVAMSQYRILHFATHGMLNNVHPELSGIILSLVDELGEPQDGFLRLHDIYNLNLSADLVVLSACQSALGKEIKGEGLVGLTRGFMYAGAARVVSSLWKVDDRATAELMKRFYEGMLGKQKLPPAAALRAAQVSMFRSGDWQSPYYWAAFVLQGEWR